MRKLGSALMIGGAAIGFGVGATMLAGVHLIALPWLVTVGLVKLTLIASGGLMATGAVCVRLANRNEQRQQLPRTTGTRQDQ
jgi:hypothetical protein